jgi:hypothetical protein
MVWWPPRHGENVVQGVSQVISARPFPALFFIAFCVLLGTAPGVAPAAPGGQAAIEAGKASTSSSLLHHIDTFPACAEVRRCWRNSAGQLRCGLVTRCQECKWVRRCTRAAGCGWEQVCKWGPYKPPLQTN